MSDDPIKTGTLSVTRKTGERVEIGEHISVRVVQTWKGKVRLAITAPRLMKVLRPEAGAAELGDVAYLYHAERVAAAMARDDCTCDAASLAIIAEGLAERARRLVAEHAPGAGEALDVIETAATGLAKVAARQHWPDIDSATRAQSTARTSGARQVAKRRATRAARVGRLVSEHVEVARSRLREG